jgi:secondary thiamine-phosphate synthase enzyme
MAMYQESLTVATAGRASHEITSSVVEAVHAADVGTGLVHVFLHHTSASLMLCENVDPDVREDLERFFSNLVTDGDRMFAHRAEGHDDMSAHVRTVLTHSDLSLPVKDGRLDLGRYQGVYVWEHRYQGYDRRVTVTVSGE